MTPRRFWPTHKGLKKSWEYKIIPEPPIIKLREEYLARAREAEEELHVVEGEEELQDEEREAEHDEEDQDSQATSLSFDQWEQRNAE
eukprot:5671740-Amphidinium_carterae.1